MMAVVPVGVAILSSMGWMLWRISKVVHTVEQNTKDIGGLGDKVEREKGKAAEFSSTIEEKFKYMQLRVETLHREVVAIGTNIQAMQREMEDFKQNMRDFKNEMREFVREAHK